MRLDSASEGKQERAGAVRAAGFSLVELLTVLAILAVLATLLLSATASARLRSRQVVCQGQLRQVSLAVFLYQEDTSRRPRSVTRLTQRPSCLPNPRALLCPADPVPREARASATKGAWGNLASPSQQPSPARQAAPEEGSWEAELRETTERVAFSYLHPLAWPREAWQRLAAEGGQSGVAACQLHGLRVPNPGGRAFLAYEGRTLRGQRDGSVVTRKIFRTPATSVVTPAASPVTPAEGAITVRLVDDDYPWEFYTDRPPNRR